MANITFVATIDGGTTNTRVRIWNRTASDFLLAGEAAAEVGVRNTAIDGNNQKLLTTVDCLLTEAATEAGIKPENLSLVLASGMLTSDLGLTEVPHIAAPAGVDTLAAAMVPRKIEGLSPREIWFIPGMKNLADEAITAETIVHMDMMRGEETEAVGMLELYASASLMHDPVHPGKERSEANRKCEAEGAGEMGARPSAEPLVLVLPGSHNKYIAVDEKGVIRGSLTTLAGELLRSLTLDSILAGTVERRFVEMFEAGAFLRGVAWGRSMGLGHGAFLCRICGLFDGYTPVQAQNYLLGLLLADDVRTLQQDPLFSGCQQARFIVAGRNVLQQAYACLLQNEGYTVELVPRESQKVLSGKGALALARRRGLI